MCGRTDIIQTSQLIMIFRFCVTDGVTKWHVTDVHSPVYYDINIGVNISGSGLWIDHMLF